MATDYRLPHLGEDIDEAEVIAVLVAVGDRVEGEQGVIEVETEKANLEVPAPFAGEVTAIHVAVGDMIRPGQAIVTLEAAADAPAAPEAAPAPAPPPAPQPAAPAAAIAAEPPPPPAAPAAAPAPAPAPEAAPPAPAIAAEAGAAPAAGSGARAPVPAAPSVRIFAREIGVAIGEVRGSGPGGRISMEDVKEHARASLGAAAPAPPAAAGPAAGAPPAPAPLPDLSQFGEIERERLGGIRRTTARTLSQSWAQSPLVTLQRKADVTELDAIRREQRERVAAAGGQLTMLPILMKVAAGALREFPRLNAAIDAAAGEIVYRRYVHVGVATDTPDGLVVPVVRDADRKTITELAIEIRELTARARERRSTLGELRGGTFTISNLGGMGVGFFNAILHPPEVGILSVGAAETEPVWTHGMFQPRLRLPLALNFDHRLIDGADGARALAWIVEALERPLLLAL